MKLIGLFSLLLAASPADAEERQLIFEASVVVEGVPAGTVVDVYLPLAQDTARQTIIRTDINANMEGEERKEARYGNRYWHGHVDAASGETLTISLTHIVERRTHGVDQPTEAERSLFVAPNSRVPVDGPLVQGIRAELGLGAEHTAEDKARAIYDYVIDHVEYKKAGTGWGNGDTEWACTQKYGNCTDFHALFTSLARAEGLPARFEIGFPISEASPSGNIGGYHCWVEVALPEKGWFPIDASEAKKHPERADALFGRQPADRLRMTVGRDLQLEGQQAAPLNFLVYPHVEVGGVAYDQVKTQYSYRAAPPVEDRPTSGQ
jgi:transglutaminase-like putative cysteine protease